MGRAGRGAAPEEEQQQRGSRSPFRRGRGRLWPRGVSRMPFVAAAQVAAVLGAKFCSDRPQTPIHATRPPRQSSRAQRHTRFADASECPGLKRRTIDTDDTRSSMATPSSRPLPVGDKRPPIGTTGNTRARPLRLRAKPGGELSRSLLIRPLPQSPTSATRTPPRSAEVHSGSGAGRRTPMGVRKASLTPFSVRAGRDRGRR